jgi:AcrR family transcriptional regulator
MPAASPASSATESRRRILDAALALMSEHGVAGTSMRQLAAACELNVATLYHHFPSKSDLLGAVISEQGYLERMRTDDPPAELRRGADPRRRLARFVAWLWDAAQQEEAVWRLLDGESLRADPVARAEALALVDGIDLAVTAWITELVPEVGDRAEPVARLVRATLFSLIVEHLALGPDEARAAGRVHDLVDVVLPRRAR